MDTPENPTEARTVGISRSRLDSSQLDRERSLGILRRGNIARIQFESNGPVVVQNIQLRVLEGWPKDAPSEDHIKL